MNPYGYIVDPNNGKKIDINTKKGKKIVSNYIYALNGGSIKSKLYRSYSTYTKIGDSIDDIKKQIAQKEGIPSDQQRLVFSGTTVNNLKKVDEFNIDDILEFIDPSYIPEYVPLNHKKQLLFQRLVKFKKITIDYIINVVSCYIRLLPYLMDPELENTRTK